MNSQTDHPLIDGLFRFLPPPGAEWAPEARAKWLRAAASISGLVYQQPVDEPIGAEIQEWHAGEGWHLHCCEGCDDASQVAGAPGLRQRIPAATQRHRRMTFDVHDDDTAFREADNAFRLTAFGLNMQ